MMLQRWAGGCDDHRKILMDIDPFGEPAPADAPTPAARLCCWIASSALFGVSPIVSLDALPTPARRNTDPAGVPGSCGGTVSSRDVDVFLLRGDAAVRVTDR